MALCFVDWFERPPLRTLLFNVSEKSRNTTSLHENYTFNLSPDGTLPDLEEDWGQKDLPPMHERLLSPSFDIHQKPYITIHSAPMASQPRRCHAGHWRCDAFHTYLPQGSLGCHYFLWLLRTKCGQKIRERSSGLMSWRIGTKFVLVDIQERSNCFMLLRIMYFWKKKNCQSWELNDSLRKGKNKLILRPMHRSVYQLSNNTTSECWTLTTIMIFLESFVEANHWLVPDTDSCSDYPFQVKEYLQCYFSAVHHSIC